MGWRPRPEGLGTGGRVYGLAQGIREPRQETGCGLRGGSGSQPFRPVDDGRFHGHSLLHRKAADLVGARGPTAGGRLCQESQGRHPAGQPGPCRQRLAAGVRIHQGRRGGRHQGVPYLDESPHLAARRRPSGGVRSGPRDSGLGRVDRPGPDAASRSPRTEGDAYHRLQLAGRGRFRLRGPGRHGLPYDRWDLLDHESGLCGHGRAVHHDRTRQGSVAGRNGGQEHLPRQRWPARVQDLLVRGRRWEREALHAGHPGGTRRPTGANCRERGT